MKKKHLIIGAIAILAVGFLMYLARENGKSSVKRELVYYVDSLSSYQNKLGEEYKQRLLVEHDKEALKTKFASLEEEYKKLKDNPLVITKVVTTTKIDTLKIPLIKENDTTLVYNYDKTYSENDKVVVKGKVDLANMETTISTIEMTSGLFYDIVEDKNGMLSVIVRSTNPLVSIDKVEGALFDISQSKYFKKKVTEKKKSFSFIKRFSVSAYVGYGASLYNQQVILTPQVGVGLTYRIF